MSDLKKLIQKMDDIEYVEVQKTDMKQVLQSMLAESKDVDQFFSKLTEGPFDAVFGQWLSKLDPLELKKLMRKKSGNANPKTPQAVIDYQKRMDRLAKKNKEPLFPDKEVDIPKKPMQKIMPKKKDPWAELDKHMEDSVTNEEQQEMNEIWTDLAHDALKGIGRWIGGKSRSRIDDIRKDNKEKRGRDNSTKRSSGSDEYDHIINKYRK